MKKIIILCCVSALALLVWEAVSIVYKRYTPIKVGILHSLTGYMESSERPVVDATLLAIEQINAAGGMLGRLLEPVVADGASDPDTFAEQAKKLITEDKVVVIFGCWSSACRKAVQAVVEKYEHLLFYPVQHEGVEESSNIIYTGATPNQQMYAALMWSKEKIGKHFFIVGSDYIYPRMAGIIARTLLDSVDAVIVGEEYLLVGTLEVDAVIEQIKNANPDVIMNTINGNTNYAFFKALRAAGITPDKIPTMSFSIGEPEVQELGSALTEGDYAAWSYFQSIDSKENRKFVKAFKKRFGQDRVINDPMQTGYFGVYFWYQTAKVSSGAAPLEVLASIHNQSRVVPEENLSIDGYNRHTWRMSRIGKINAEGQFDIVWSTEKTIYPIVYPFKSHDEWEDTLSELYTSWGGKWSRK